MSDIPKPGLLPSHGFLFEEFFIKLNTWKGILGWINHELHPVTTGTGEASLVA